MELSLIKSLQLLYVCTTKAPLVKEDHDQCAMAHNKILEVLKAYEASQQVAKEPKKKAEAKPEQK